MAQAFLEQWWEMRAGTQLQTHAERCGRRFAPEAEGADGLRRAAHDGSPLLNQAKNDPDEKRVGVVLRLAEAEGFEPSMGG